MSLTKKEIKQRYFDKVYKNAETVLCACGCGEMIKNKDRFGRDKHYISGHNTLTKYDDPIQYKREWNHRNRKSRHESKVARGQRLKAKVVCIMGAKCIRCELGYDHKNGCVFQLHHRNPSDKLFQVNARTLATYSWEQIMKEIAKCDLLCANCHFIIHNKEY